MSLSQINFLQLLAFILNQFCYVLLTIQQPQKSRVCKQPVFCWRKEVQELWWIPRCYCWDWELNLTDTHRARWRWLILSNSIFNNFIIIIAWFYCPRFWFWSQPFHKAEESQCFGPKNPPKRIKHHSQELGMFTNLTACNVTCRTATGGMNRHVPKVVWHCRLAILLKYGIYALRYM